VECRSQEPERAQQSFGALGFNCTPVGEICTFLTDRSQVPANRAIRGRMLQGYEPASTEIVAETVDGKWLLEIEAICAA
jgi:2-iminobutanoate/2-iminopropanoate deaminase